METQEHCAFLLDNCRQCDRFFRRDERYLACPDCGISRKCRAYPVKGTRFCVKHGGKANLKHHYPAREGRVMKTGKTSKSLVANLASKYIQISKSGPYQTNKATVDVLDIRITELLSRIDQREAAERLEKLVNAWQKLKDAFPGMKTWLTENAPGRKAYKALDEEAEKAYHDYAAWKQIMEVFDLRRKVTKDEMSILKDMKALISAEDAYELTAQLLAAVVLVLESEPNGAKLIKAIHSEFARILGEPYLDPFGGRESEVIDIDTRSVDN